MVKIYRFQRLMIAAAVIIWAVFAGRLVYKGIKGETMDVVDTFCENVYYDISADISAVRCKIKLQKVVNTLDM